MSHQVASPHTASPHTTPPPSILPQLTFTQGFLVGQVSVIIIVVALIRYLLLEDPPSSASADQVNKKRRRKSSSSSTFPVTSTSSNKSGQPLSSLLSLSLSLGKNSTAVDTSQQPGRAKSPPPNGLESDGQVYGSGPALSTLERIPDAVGYDMETAADTDVGWLNVLLAHAWAGYRDDFLAGGSSRPDIIHGECESDEDNTSDGSSPSIESEDAVHRTAGLLMQEVLNRPKVEDGKLDFLDEIQVTECILGNSYPTLSNARVRPRDDQGRVRIEIDVDYNDVLSLALRTSILVNYPRPRFAVLPISLGVRITRFSGTISLSLSSHSPSTTDQEKRSRHSLELSLHPDFLLSATCSSLVGSRAKLQDIPKIQQLILQRIRSAIIDKIGWPRVFTVELPDLVKRRVVIKRKKRSRTVTRSNTTSATRRKRPQSMTSGRMEGIAEEDLDSFSEEEESTLDPQEALQRMRRRRRENAALLALAQEEEAAQKTPTRRSIRTRRRKDASSDSTSEEQVLSTSRSKRPASQYTSISRRRPNPLHQQQQSEKKSRKSKRRQEEAEEEEEIGRSPPGSLPTVEAWRKEMVRKTHGSIDR
ncbi:unnamed protein product [Sympodiomycopsis kandeliae]